MKSVVETLGERAARHPDRVALICGNQHISYGELWARIVTTACFMSDSGVREGDRVLIAAPSRPAFAYAYFATHLVGAVAVMLDPNAPASRRDELVRRTRPVLEIGTGPLGRSTSDFTSKSIDDLDQLPSRQRSFIPPALDALAEVVFTTGTTGSPKGVRLTHRNIAAAAAHINAVIGTTEKDVEVVPVPLYHSSGIARLRCCFSVGAAVVLVQGFRLPGEIFSALERHSATGLIGVPAGFAVLLRFGERGLGAFADRLRYIELGTAPMPLEHKRALMKLLPRTSLFMYYGLTEASRSVFIEFHSGKAQLATAGVPAPGVQVEVRDESSGVLCSPGVLGILWICGAHVSPGYWDNDDLSAMSFADGWVRTGDVAHLDHVGYVHLHGRKDDMINVGGFNVSPEEVERVLTEHPAVAEAACIGVPDPRGIAGQVVRAFLVAAEGEPQASDSDLSRWATLQLEPYKVPTQYEWVSQLPRTDSGKLTRATLRKQVAT